jgi:hypothetical protein
MLGKPHETLCGAFSFVPQPFASPSFESWVLRVVTKNGHAFRHDTNSANQFEAALLMPILLASQCIGSVAMEARDPFD